MSIEKIPNNYLKHSGLSFTTTLNQTTDRIKDAATLGIYHYLIGKPENWVIREQDIMNRFEMGRDAVKKRLKQLKQLGLYEKTASKDAKGKIIHWETLIHIHITEKPHSGLIDLHITENPATGKPSDWKTNPLNKERDLIKKDCLQIIAHPADERASKPISQPQPPTPKTQSPESITTSNTFNSFWEIYPRKVGKKKAHDVWKRKKLNDKVGEIVEKLKVQAAHDENWLDSQYIPHPTTYLNGERWDDEIFRREVKTKPTKSASVVASNIEQENLASIQEQKSRAEGLKVMESWNKDHNSGQKVVPITTGTAKSMGSLLEKLRK